MARRYSQFLVLYACGAVGGGLAYVGGLPIPFLLGGMIGAAVAVAVLQNFAGVQALRPDPRLRTIFVAFIGTMIGAGFTPTLLSAVPAFWPSFLAVAVYVVLAHSGGYAIMRRLGGMRPVDAFYAAMPGGLVDSSILGEPKGANLQVLAVQHFIRIILVVSIVPLLFWVATGEVVGSSAGQIMGRAGYDVGDIALVLVVSLAGIWLGRLLRMPAAQLMGPLFFCAALQVSGIIDLSAPPWLLALAQLVVGIGLGAQFSGIRAGALARGFLSGLAAVGYMLTLGLGFALALTPVVPAGLSAMFLSFAPGGVTEMNLIALSLDIGPVIVAVHHLVRILATLWVAALAGNRLFADDPLR